MWFFIRWHKNGKVNGALSYADLLSRKVVFFPINLQNWHWVLVVAFTERKVLKYYDSLAGPGQNIHLQNILHYLYDISVIDNVPFNWKEWKMVTATKKNCPQQPNGYDCGLYVLNAIDKISKGGNLQECSMNADKASLYRTRLAMYILNKVYE